jgi:hypothetical protein
MVTPLATSLFQLYKLFKNMVCILALVGLTIVLAIFQKIGQFFPNHLVNLVATLPRFLLRRSCKRRTCKRALRVARQCRQMMKEEKNRF